MCKGKSITLMCRQNLFRQQVARFYRCEERLPTRHEVRRIWSETGFRTA